MSSDMNDPRAPKGNEVRSSFDDWAEPGDTLEHPDLELITDYLTNQLPPEQIAEVKRRLDEDAEFRELAAPLVLAWTVPPLWQRDPVPRKEIARYWNDFTKRTGILRQQPISKEKPRKRRRWLKILLLTVFTPTLLLLLLFGAFFFAALVSAIPDDVPTTNVRWQEHTPTTVTADGWMPVGNAWVKLDSGAKLLTAAPPGRQNLAHLEGSARVLRVPTSRVPVTTDTIFFTLSTRAGFAASPDGEFLVNAKGDTTDVEVLTRTRVPAGTGLRTVPDTMASPMAGAVAITNAEGGPAGALILMPGESGRLQPGTKPIKLRALPGDPAGNNRLLKRLLEYMAPRIFRP